MGILRHKALKVGFNIIEDGFISVQEIVKKSNERKILKRFQNTPGLVTFENILKVKHFFSNSIFFAR